MILKYFSGSDLITDKSIDHLKIIKTFIFTLKGADRDSIDFTIIIGLFSTADTPSKLATFLTIFVKLLIPDDLK